MNKPNLQFTYKRNLQCKPYIQQQRPPLRLLLYHFWSSQLLGLNTPSNIEKGSELSFPAFFNDWLIYLL